MASESGLKMTKRSGWLSGFWNMLSKENGIWWNPRMWLVQSVIWLVLLNGVFAMALYEGAVETTSGTPKIVELFFLLMSQMMPIGVIILTQGIVVQEKRSGSAEWVLSAPLSREAFILAKLVANSLWIFATMVLMQGITFELVLMAFGVGTVPILNLFWGLALQGLYLLFWITLSLMLGTFFNSRGPVVGIPFAIIVFQKLIGGLVAKYVPWITFLYPEKVPELAAQVAAGQPIYSTSPLLSMNACVIMFTLAAIWRFKREEF